MIIKLDTAKKYFVTGGSGFIGSHMVERLLNLGCSVTVYDNYSSGRSKNLEKLVRMRGLKIIEGDSCNLNELNKAIVKHDTVFHFAAYTDTGMSYLNRKMDYKNNILATFNLLEAIEKNGIKNLIFLSSQLLYGEAEGIIDESIGSLHPTSLYGANKIACESMISAYSSLFGINATICRLSNIVGGRMWRGIIYDFIRKIKSSGNKLKILGDGRQLRNYLLIDDCIEAILTAYCSNPGNNHKVYLVGNSDSIAATEVARIVIEEMGLQGKVTVSTKGKRYGWKGDVTNIQIDTSKIRALGWSPKLSSGEAVRECARRILREANFM